MENTYTKKRDEILNSKRSQESKDSLLSSLGRNFLNQKHTIRLSEAECKMHASFIQATLQEPWSMKNKKFTDVCTLNKQNFLFSSLAKHFDQKNPLNGPNPKMAFKTNSDFVTFSDKKIKGLQLSDVTGQGVNKLADHILGH